jgi:hypothetical protein
VTQTSRYRATLFAVGLTAAIGFLPAKAPAALDMALGERQVVKDQPISACNAGARSALTALFAYAQELGSGTGEWIAYGKPDTANGSTTVASVHCYPLDPGFVVTFTCAAQVPPSTDSASAICTKLGAAFNTKAAALTPSAHGVGEALH